MPKRILFDTCFWYAFYDGDDQYHDVAMLIYGEVEMHRIVIPWPSLYETLNTKFCRKNEWIRSFAEVLRLSAEDVVSDEPYRRNALTRVLDPRPRWPKPSLVDEVIREMLQDESVRINALVTFNGPDFRDVCVRRGIDIIEN